jgi:phosphatidate cytidylyltransferase
MSEKPSSKRAKKSKAAKAPQAPAPEPPKKSGLPNLAVRLLTAAVGIPIILYLLFWAPPYAFSLVVFPAALIGARELATMTMRGQPALAVWLVIATMAASGVLVFAPNADALVALIFGIVLTGALAVLIRPDPLAEASGRMAWLIAGPLYIGGGIAAIAKLHHFEHGGTWVLLSMAFAWGSDTGGYFAGKAFGKHKLYEKISPKKTIEGSIGGLATVVVSAVVIRTIWLPELSIVHAVVLALLAGAIGQAGDLCISVIKRSTGVKDSGNIIPGHGGLLDRIDALVFTAVVTLLYAEWVLGLDATVPRLPWIAP